MLVLLLIPVLVFLARAVAWLSTSSHYRAIAHRERISATYLMEAGQAHAVSKLEENSDWDEGFHQERLRHVGGSYTIVFQDEAKDYEDGNSVNNISGRDYRDGPRGPETVVPGTVELVVHAENGGERSSGTFILGGTQSTLTEAALGAGRNIWLEGDVSVTGVENLVSMAPIEAGIHSNRDEGTDSVINWRPKRGGDRAEFSGKVSTSLEQDNAISFAGTEGVNFNAKDFETGAAKLPMPETDIEAEVLGKGSSAAPSVNAYGTTTLSGGDFYQANDLELQGDLVLDGGHLYVNGDLTINGSITGKGAVYVNGRTRFKGDAEVEASEAGIALYSEGPVELTGFDGKAFLAALRRDSPAADAAYTGYEDQIRGANVYKRRVGGAYKTNLSAAGNEAQKLGEEIDRVVGPTSRTGQFIKTQLKAIEVKAKSGADPATNRYEPNLDKVGTAYFQGLIVSNDYIYADNSISILGSVWANGTDKEGETRVNGRSIHPGDIYLGDGTELVFNKALLDLPEATVTSTAKLELRSWLR